eukprot:scaffold41649_cov13-Tisochrysis_lutea.AAC.1
MQAFKVASLLEQGAPATLSSKYMTSPCWQRLAAEQPISPERCMWQMHAAHLMLICARSNPHACMGYKMGYSTAAPTTTCS